MHVRAFRRQFTGLWSQLPRLISPIVALEVLLLLVMSRVADAATPVAYLQIEHASSYEALRRYAGRTAPGRASELGFKQAGELHQVLVDQGDAVVEGQLLARQSAAAADARLREAQADVAVAEANLAAARARADLAAQAEARFTRLRGSGHVSEQDYEDRHLNARAREAEYRVAEASLARAHAARQAAEIALAETSLQAPFAGVVQQRHLDEGTQVRPGEPVLRLVESGRIKALVGIPDSQAMHMTAGDSYPLLWNGRTLEASLTAILPEVDVRTRTLTAVLEVENDNVPLGAVVELELSHGVPGAGFWLPLTALAESERGLWGVYVVNARSVLERRLVEILHTEADRAFVRGTLQNGDRIVATGVHRLVPGQTVEPVSQG
jgi:RND family efflux transporter MFP subunit